MPIYHVSLAFTKLPDTELNDFVDGVISGLSNNPAYPSPAVSTTDMRAALSQFQLDQTAMVQGGPSATAAKNNSRTVVLNLMRLEANYVQGACKNDLATLLSSGFEAISINRTQSPLDKPAILEILNQMSTQLLLKVTPVTNAHSYEAQTQSGLNPWQAAGTFPSTRNMAIQGLVPGTVYTVQVRAVGGSLDYSNWSDPVSHMAM